MNSGIAVAVLITFLVFAAYSWFTTNPSDGFMDINKQQYETSFPREPPLEASLTRVVSPGGPSSPSQRPPREAPVTIADPEKPFDPQAQSYESAEIPERLRHPERSFSPGMNNLDLNLYHLP